MKFKYVVLHMGINKINTVVYGIFTKQEAKSFSYGIKRQKGTKIIITRVIT